MKKFRVFLEAVDDPEDPVLIARLMKLSDRDKKAVTSLLGKLPAQLAEGVDQEGARYLDSFMDGVGARIQVKEILPGAKVRSENRAPRQSAVALGLFSRFSWCIEVFARTWRHQLLLLLIVLAATMLSESIIAWLGDSLGVRELVSEDPHALAKLLETPAFLIMALALRTAGFFLLFWYLAALIRLTDGFMEEDKDISLATLLGSAWQRLPDLITAVITWQLPLFLGLGLAVLAAGGLFLPEYPSYAAFITLVVLLPICFSLVAFAMVVPVVVLETVGPWQGLRRAWTLGQGRRWRLFGNLLLSSMVLVSVSMGCDVLLNQSMTSLGIQFVWLLSYGVGLLSLFLLNFVVTAFYYESRILSEGWEPHWELVPHPSWSVSETAGLPARARGVRAWMELLIALVVALALLGGLVVLLARLPTSLFA